MNKRCSVCKVEQPIDEYYRDCQSADGRQNTCRTCKKAARPKPVHCAPVGDWQTEAACKTVDPHIFWADKGEEGPALRICRTCTVQPQCLDWALRNEQALFVIGGTTAQERQRMLRQRRLNGAA
jgi:WhiB family redox-sensing transcriptional regulator